MKRLVYRILPCLIVCLGLSVAPALGEEIEGGNVWTVPDCEYVQSGVPITFTLDEGLNLAHASQMRFIERCTGLATLDQPNAMLALTDDYRGAYLWRSDDAGCKWKVVAKTEPSTFRLAIHPGGTAYIYLKGSNLFYRWDGVNLEEHQAPDDIFGFAVNPDDPMQMRIGSYGCQIYESIDGGERFLPLGEPAPNDGATVLTVEFNPEEWDDALCGTLAAYRTVDAGQSWTPVGGFDKLRNDRVFVFEYSPKNKRVVWARANMDISGEDTRDILMSVDGGGSFQSVIQQGETAVDQDGVVRTVMLSNAPTMAAHPDRSDVLYFVYSMYIQNYATDLFRYDVSTDELKVVHIDSVDGINSIAFNPADASVMYLGMEESNDPSPGPDLPMAGAGQESTVAVTVSPNPFNPTANICLSLSNPAQVRLDIFNIAGQRVTTLVDRHLTAGDHTFTWDGSAFASGVYLYRVQADDFVDSRKMLLLK